jgi:hypothetical protein
VRDSSRRHTDYSVRAFFFGVANTANVVQSLGNTYMQPELWIADNVQRITHDGVSHCKWNTRASPASAQVRYTHFTTAPGFLG